MNIIFPHTEYTVRWMIEDSGFDPSEYASLMRGSQYGGALDILLLSHYMNFPVVTFIQANDNTIHENQRIPATLDALSPTNVLETGTTLLLHNGINHYDLLVL